MFKEYNANPYGANINDCVIRAISFCTNKSYDDVFDDLCVIADDIDMEINSFTVFNKYLKNLGYELREVTTGITVKKVAEIFKVYDEKIPVLVNGHITSVYGGDTYDTWNCNRYKAQFIWIKNLAEVY